MNKEERAILRRAVERARRLLEDEVADQLEGAFGILQSGKVLDDAPGDPTVRQRLLELITHHQAGGETVKEAVERATRELAFTTLNRFVALKMAERRGLVRECISKGPMSDGIRELADCAPGLRAALPDGGYRLLLEAVMDEISLGLSALFDRRAPAGLIWPRPKALDELLDILNAAELAGLWEQDETIGWVYQYFNPKEEREAMRKASAAPRNSRELAVRNQFFTPRYVVAFLTDNTLGRIWYEMRKGDTALKESCRYLVRRPSEVFLEPGESAPPSKDDEADLAQEELLRRPVYIEHRPKKDPRDIKVLDPACGSGHFLLYAFELLERIYEEAWADAESPASEATGRTLQEDYGSIDELRHAAPKLIIEHNLHGIDIDPRAVQIAALALWLRAQKAWQGMGLKPTERSQILRSNIVTAEPMPGEDDMRRELVDSLRPRVLGQLVDLVFERMRLAGEAGSLLKIEEEIKDGIAEARKQWLESSEGEQQLLFPGMGPARPEQQKLRFDLAGVDNEQFWGEAEGRILEALKAYSERAENGRAFRRRLFAEDAARGFAFIDLCRKRYDVVLMNPPFGDTAVPTRNYIGSRYPDAKEDIYSAFVARFVQKLTNGFVGVISNRTGFFLTGMRRWREQILLGPSGLLLVADLGDGVLDDALVEVAAYVLGKSSGSSVFFRMLDQADKERPLQALIEALCHGQLCQGLFLNANGAFNDLPESRISYWAPPSVRRICRTLAGAGGSGLEVKFGLSTKDDFRFVRTCWEVSPARIVLDQDDAEPGRPWMYLAKGGEYAVHYCDIHLVVNWAGRGHEIAARVIQQYPYLNGDANWVLHREVPYGRPGVTYTKRTTSGFSPRFLPSGCLISDKGCTIYADDDAKLPHVMVIYASRAFSYMLEFNVASGDSVRSGSAARDYEIGTVAAVPIPHLEEVNDEIARDMVSIWRRKAQRDGREEVGRFFAHAWSSDTGLKSLSAYAAALRDEELTGYVQSLAEASDAEGEIRRCYMFEREAIKASEAEFGPDVTKYPKALDEQSQVLLAKLWTAPISEVIAQTSEALGFRRFISKMTYIADRRLELLCHRFGAHPEAIVRVLKEFPATVEETTRLALDVLSYSVGCAFGRWDVRMALDPSLVPKLPDPFDPLPICPPGMLVGPDGLPAKPDGIVSEEWLRARSDANTLPPRGSVAQPTIKDTEYPLPIAWDGILVDDPGLDGNQPHRDDVVRRGREVLDLIWKDKAHEIEQEACEMLGVSTLRDYFRKPSGFFDDHLKRYSKSRRKAPIYWPLSTASGAYTVWVYYHRLTEDTLYRIVSDYVSPKISQVEDRITQREAEHRSAQGRDAARLAKELSELTSLLQELKELRDELLRVAHLPYRPNLNDGVQITAAPLWRLFRLPRWRSELERTWQALERGDYDWAHLAYAIWPERVRETCRRDRSIAIAHGLEELYEERSAPQRHARRRRGQAG